MRAFKLHVSPFGVLNATLAACKSLIEGVDGWHASVPRWKVPAVSVTTPTKSPGHKTCSVFPLVRAALILVAAADR